MSGRDVLVREVDGVRWEYHGRRRLREWADGHASEMGHIVQVSPNGTVAVCIACGASYSCLVVTYMAGKSWP